MDTTSINNEADVALQLERLKLAKAQVSSNNCIVYLLAAMLGLFVTVGVIVLVFVILIIIGAAAEAGAISATGLLLCA